MRSDKADLEKKEINQYNKINENDLEQVLQYFHALVFSSISTQDVPKYVKDKQQAQEIAFTLSEIRRALSMTAKGDFTCNIDSKGFMAGAMKSLQSNLKHLNWMARRVANGDMEQKMDFMGDLSEAFNSMVEQFSTTLEKLSEEEERWQLAMLCSRDGIWEIKLNSGMPPYYSPRIFELLGINPKNAPGIADWPKLFHPDDHELLTHYRRFVLWDNPPHSFELDHKLLCGDGIYRWFLSHVMTLLDPVQGKPLRIIGVISDIQYRKEREEHFSYQATHDVLTDLPNRILFNEHLRNGIAIARRAGSHLAVVIVDLDKFKLINDNLGHHAGDHVLVEVAKRMQKSMRESDMVSRIGGDEFAMVLAFSKNEWQAITKALQRTMRAVKKPMQIDGKEIEITASFGVSVYPSDSDSPKTLMEYADEAMYYAKALGRDACVFWKNDKSHTVYKFNKVR